MLMSFPSRAQGITPLIFSIFSHPQRVDAVISPSAVSSASPVSVSSVIMRPWVGRFGPSWSGYLFSAPWLAFVLPLPIACRFLFFPRWDSWCCDTMTVEVGCWARPGYSGIGDKTMSTHISDCRTEHPQSADRARAVLPGAIWTPAGIRREAHKLIASVPVVCACGRKGRRTSIGAPYITIRADGAYLTVPVMCPKCGLTSTITEAI